MQPEVGGDTSGTSSSAAQAMGPAALIAAGRAAFKVADYADSERLFVQALPMGGDEHVCRQHLARIYNHQGRWDQSLEQWLWLRQYGPRSLEPQLQIARSLFRLKRHAEAAREFEAVLALDPDHAEGKRTLLQIAALLKSGSAETPTAPATATHSAQDLLDQGRASFKAGDYKQSEKMLLQALDAGADEADCRQHLARIYNHGGNWPQALVHWQWLHDRSSKALEPLQQVARCQFRLGRYREAAIAFKAVLALAPDHAEARQMHVHLRTRLIDLGRTTYKAGEYAEAEAIYRQALETGADEQVCRQHLARIYNQCRDWPKALEQWQWLRSHDPAQLEPALQTARALLRLDRVAEAAAGFRAVLQMMPGYAEAQRALHEIEARMREAALLRDFDATENWLSTVPDDKRWLTARDHLATEIGAMETLLNAAVRRLHGLTKALKDFGEAAGEVSGHRQLFELQANARAEELGTHLKSARRSARSLAERTDKIFGSLTRYTGQQLPMLRISKQPLARAAWRETITKLALQIYTTQGFDSALHWLYSEAPTEDRSQVLAALGVAIREANRNDALRLFWLSYGASPSRLNAERIASRMFQAGDISNAAALMGTVKEVGEANRPSSFMIGMRQSIAIRKNGLSIPIRRKRKIAARPGSVAYVASGSLPYQTVGYTVRTHELLTGLVNAGGDCVCFTRPGYPWDRPQNLPAGSQVPERHYIGNVHYIHTPLAEAFADPGNTIEAASRALEYQFRVHEIETVHAASNSRSALPALIAARRIGAKFIYEVRGLWELTAASRFAGWEETERYRLDRDLEVLVATHADHVLTITEGIARELRASGVSSQRLSLLPNAVDPDVFVPLPKEQGLMTRLGLRSDDFIVVYAGSLTSYEGLDDLIVALSFIRDRGFRPKLVLVGGGEFRSELDAVVARHNMSAAVTFVGRVRPDEIRAYLSLADVVAIPRKPYKVCMVVSPLKPFEAMSMEKAVILSDLPVLREIIADGETGLICKPADPADLAVALERLAMDTELRNRLGRAARQWVIKHRSWSRNARYLKELYLGLNESVPEDRIEGSLDSRPFVYPLKGTSAAVRYVPDAGSI